MNDTRFPKISVIVPSYNYASSLGPCIEALLDQTCQPHEVIIVDDHSTDNSYAIAQDYPVVALQTPQNSGVAGARNHGVRHATGDILFFVDADVVLDAGALDAAVIAFAQSDDIVSVCGIYEPRPFVRDSLWEECRSLQAYVWRASSIGDVSGGFFSLGAIRRETFDTIGPFNESLRQTEEIDYGERLDRQGRIVLTDLIRGRHDDDHAFWPMMKKFWRRSRDRVPFYFKKRGTMKGFELPCRLRGTFLTGVAWGLALMALLFPAFGLSGLAATLLVILWNERDIYRIALRYLGLAKLPAFVFWYFCFHTAAGLGVAMGLAKFATSAKFRSLYGDWDAIETAV